MLKRFASYSNDKMYISEDVYNLKKIMKSNLNQWFS